ncbi:MAG: tRNA dihydrouridine synthase DusB [Nitrospinota bacterium]
MLLIGETLIHSPFLLAPIAGFTDSVVRQIALEEGAGLVVTELISANGLLQKSKKTFDMLPEADERSPQAVQLFGGEADILADAAKLVEDNNRAAIIDLNFGCPVKKVIKNRAGAAILKSPTNAFKIVEAVASNVSLPVTVKIRTGWNSESDNLKDIAKAIEDGGAKAITIHGRTAKQGYSGTANWELIKETAKYISIPVIGNGDILSAQDGVQRLKESQLQYVMIGRGAIGNLSIFKDATCLLNGTYKPDQTEVDIIEKRWSILQKHINLSAKKYGNQTGGRIMKSHYRYYSKGFKGASKFRDQIVRVDDLQAQLQIATEYFESLLLQELNCYR